MRQAGPVLRVDEAALEAEAHFQRQVHAVFKKDLWVKLLNARQVWFIVWNP